MSMYTSFKPLLHIFQLSLELFISFLILVFNIYLSFISTLSANCLNIFCHMYWYAINFVFLKNSLLEISELLSFEPVSYACCMVLLLGCPFAIILRISSPHLGWIPWSESHILFHLLILVEYLIQYLPKKQCIGYTF